MADHQWERVEDDSPDRCQSNGGQGQCPFKKVPGLDYCPRHKAGGEKDLDRKKVRNYQLGKWQSRVEQFADNGEIKSIREEIGITRMLLETIHGQCHEETDLILYSNKISDLVMRIEKLVASCHRMEQSTGMLLDKGMVMALADSFVAIISKHISDDDIVATISQELVEAIARTQGQSNEQTS